MLSKIRVITLWVFSYYTFLKRTIANKGYKSEIDKMIFYFCNMNKKVAFYTLGCKLNYSETSTISRDFKRNNYKIVSASKKADIYVINTCSVTQNADNKFKSVVNKIHNNEKHLIKNTILFFLSANDPTIGPIIATKKPVIPIVQPQ